MGHTSAPSDGASGVSTQQRDGDKLGHSDLVSFDFTTTLSIVVGLRSVSRAAERQMASVFTRVLLLPQLAGKG